MKYLPLILALVLGGCNYASETTPEGVRKTAVAVGVLHKPDQASTGTVANAGPPETRQEGPSTSHTKITAEEVEAQVSMYMIGGGIGVMLLGAGLMYAAFKAPTVVPTWFGKLVIKIGAGVVAWGSVSGATRNYIIGGIVIVGIAWMYYGSVKHNKKKEVENGTSLG